jgi:hypothetical protein
MQKQYRVTLALDVYIYLYVVVCIYHLG